MFAAGLFRPSEHFVLPLYYFCTFSVFQASSRPNLYLCQAKVAKANRQEGCAPQEITL